jgi:hypothetical protein
MLKFPEHFDEKLFLSNSNGVAKLEQEPISVELLWRLYQQEGVAPVASAEKFAHTTTSQRHGMQLELSCQHIQSPLLCSKPECTYLATFPSLLRSLRSQVPNLVSSCTEYKGPSSGKDRQVKTAFYLSQRG